MPGRHSKANLKGNVTEPLGKLPQRDKESVNTYFPANRQLKYLLKVNWKQERSLSKIGNNSTHLESSFNYCYQKKRSRQIPTQDNSSHSTHKFVTV